jgi:hypothetical protein
MITEENRRDDEGRKLEGKGTLEEKATTVFSSPSFFSEESLALAFSDFLEATEADSLESFLSRDDIAMKSESKILLSIFRSSDLQILATNQLTASSKQHDEREQGHCDHLRKTPNCSVFRHR